MDSNTTVTLLHICQYGQSISIHRPDHHDNGVYRIQHVLPYCSHHADDDNLHRRGDGGRARRRGGLDDCLRHHHYQHIQREGTLVSALQRLSVLDGPWFSAYF